MAGAIVRGMKTPAKEASRLLSFSRDLKREGEIYSAELTEEGAKELQKLGPCAPSKPILRVILAARRRC